MPTTAPCGSSSSDGVAVRDEGVARVLALEHGGEREARRQVHRHVLERVDGEVGAAVVERGLELLDEQALAADLGQRAVEDLVAARGHRRSSVDLDADARLSSARTCSACQSARRLSRVAMTMRLGHRAVMLSRRRLAACIRCHDDATQTAALRPQRPPARPRAREEPPLVDDIRLLGRILGDVIREQEGKAAFELVERIRQLSVAYRLQARRRSAGRALDRLLKSLSGDQTVSVIRAFSYFSHLANIAEDRHHVRRRAVHERAGPPAGGLAGDGASSAWRGAASAPTAIVADADARLHLAGADRAPDRGAAQEHPRRRARDRRAARPRATPLREPSARARRQRGAAARARHAALADAHAALPPS